MNKFVNTALTWAIPMTRGAALTDKRIQILPEPNNKNYSDADVGYMVEYQNSYKFWSPKSVFESVYRPINGLTFGLAIEALKRGERVARAGWNGKNMYLVLVLPQSDAVLNGDTPCFCYRAFALPDGANGKPKKPPQLSPYIAIKTADEKLVPWLANQTDMLAEDWYIIH